MRQAEKRALTRRNVLRAAQDLFGRSGYHQATLRDIAEEAGVSKGAVYYNFASKEELFLALLDARMDERLREIRAVNSEPDHAARDYIENVKRNREWITLFFEFVAHAARDGCQAADTRSGRRASLRRGRRRTPFDVPEAATASDEFA